MNVSAPPPPVHAPAIRAPRASDGAAPGAMRAAAARFEAQALGAMLQPLLAEGAGQGAFTGGAAEAQWRPMLVDHYAAAWAGRGGVGIAGAVLAEMLRMQNGTGVITTTTTDPEREGTPA